MSDVQVWMVGGVAMIMLAIAQLFRSRKTESLRRRMRRFIGHLFDILGG